MRLDEHVRTQWDARLDKLCLQLGMAATNPDADAVHDLRVAIRRLSQVIIVFPDLFPNGFRNKFRARLKKTLRTAGEVRNLDVGADLLDTLEHDGSIAAAQQLRERRAAALEPLLERVHKWQERDWCAKAKPKFRGDPRSPAASVAARALLNRLATAFFLAGNAAVGKSAHEMHQFRIAAKRFRYSLEMFAPLYPAAMKKRIAKVREFQDILGHMNDFATTSTLIDPGHVHVAKALEDGRIARAAEFDREWKAFLKPGLRAEWRQFFAQPKPIAPATKRPAARSRPSRTRSAPKAGI